MYFFTGEKLGSTTLPLVTTLSINPAGNKHQSGFRIYLSAIAIGRDIYARLVPNSSFVMGSPSSSPPKVQIFGQNLSTSTTGGGFPRT
ncbi:MAG: hypothetical protein ACUVRY_03140 [Thermoanaerobaculaceae bacterium]